MDELTLGPLLFHWSPDKRRDFYFRIADEAPIDTVYLGEVICAKRVPMYESCLSQIVDRLQAAGKHLVFATLAEVMQDRERALVRELCDSGFDIEANDATALYYLRGKPHRIGPFFNAYNEQTLAYLVDKGATHFTLNPELPKHAIAVLGEAAAGVGVPLEVQVYGRASLAVSARCYHARAYDRHKDNCMFVCETHPDGMVLSTLDKTPFLAINGIQALSHNCLNLAFDIDSLQQRGVHSFRLSPHDCDMVTVASLFRDLLEGRRDAAGTTDKLTADGLHAPFANGFFHKTEGHRWIIATNG